MIAINMLSIVICVKPVEQKKRIHTNVACECSLYYVWKNVPRDN